MMADLRTTLINIRNFVVLQVDYSSSAPVYGRIMERISHVDRILKGEENEKQS